VDVEGVGDRRVGPAGAAGALVGLEQEAGVGQGAGGGGDRDEADQRDALGGVEADDVLLVHPGLLAGVGRVGALLYRPAFNLAHD